MSGEPDLVQDSTDDNTNGYVTYLQQMLQHHGYYQDGQVDGIFGPITDGAVRQYQQDNGLTVDGWVGPITWGVLTGETQPDSNDDSGGGYDQDGNEEDSEDGMIRFDLNDFPALYRVYQAYQNSGGDEIAAANEHLAMIGVNPEGMDTDGDDTAYA